MKFRFNWAFRMVSGKQPQATQNKGDADCGQVFSRMTGNVHYAGGVGSNTKSLGLRESP